jgi:hypothetical protein
VRQSDAASLAAIAMLVTTCAWLELDRAPVLVAVIAAALIAARWLGVPDAPSAETAPPPLTRDGFVRSLPIGAVIALPTLVLLVGTLREEFPFSGDHIHHLVMGRVSLKFWLGQLPWVALFAAGVLALRRFRVPSWPIVAFAVLFAWSFAGAAPESAPRYPAASYLLDVPLQYLAKKLVWSSPLDAHRITTALSLVAWLYVLRPLALRRWPDLAILPFALFFYWQQDVVYYDTTAYLEPWSIVFVLTAIELLASDRPQRSWLPVLLVGVACGCKEQPVLIFPWVGLATLAFIPRTRRAWAAAAVNGVLAIAPFLVWYQVVRPMTKFARQSGLASIDELVDGHRVRVFGWRVLEQFGWSGVAMLAASLAAAIALAVRVKERRWITACLFGAAAMQVAFFYTDQISIPWTGYPRFHLFALALFGFAAWMPDPRVRPRLAAALIALAQLPTLVTTVALAFRPDPARNFFEHHDAPIYFPIASLVLEAKGDGVLPLHSKIAIRPITPEVYGPMEQVYPTLRYDWIGGVTDCRCGPGHENLLVRLVAPARLRANEADRPIPDEDARCLADVKATYAHVYQRDLDDRPTGLLGVGCR